MVERLVTTRTRSPLGRRVQRVVEIVFLTASLIIGLGVISSCTVAGFSSVSGAFTALAIGFSLFFSIMLVGGVYLFTSMSRDLRLQNAGVLPRPRRPLDQRIRRGLELFFLVLSIIVGLSIVSACGLVGISPVAEKDAASIAMSVALAVILIGVVFLFTRMSRDVRLLNDRRTSGDEQSPRESADS